MTDPTIIGYGGLAIFKCLNNKHYHALRQLDSASAHIGIAGLVASREERYCTSCASCSCIAKPQPTYSLLTVCLPRTPHQRPADPRPGQRLRTTSSIAMAHIVIANPVAPITSKANGLINGRTRLRPIIHTTTHHTITV